MKFRNIVGVVSVAAYGYALANLKSLVFKALRYPAQDSDHFVVISEWGCWIWGWQ